MMLFARSRDSCGHDLGRRGGQLWDCRWNGQRRALYPAGIAVANSGTLYVADACNHEIRNGVPADLKITCTDGTTIVPNRTLDTYTITVTTGLGKPERCSCQRHFPVQVQNVTYTATAKNGAT